MQKIIKPSVVKGSVNAPASKSMMQRAVAAALLAEGKTIIRNPSFSDDGNASIDIARKLGAIIETGEEQVIVNGGFNPKENEINCGESGLSMRMFTPIASLYKGEMIVNGKGSLLKRPVTMIEESLSQLGVEINSNNGLLPLKFKGPLQGGKAFVDGSISSQLLTGLLMALPVAERDSILTVNDLKSKPYIDMTLQLLSDFGIEIENDHYQTFNIKGQQKYKSLDYTVEGDWSGASFLLVAAALNGKVKIDFLQKNSKQSDIEIVKVLEMAGASIDLRDHYIEVEKKILNPFKFDATECPDLFPPIVALAAHCKGISEIKGAERLKHKESDRATVLQQEFTKLGVKIEVKGNDMLVYGGKVNGGRIDSNNDHRITMAAAVTALSAESGIVIDGAECVAKSYPEFFDDLNSIIKK